MAATNPPGDVEFLDDPVAGEPAETAVRAGRSRRTVAVIASFVLAIAGAALAVVAPFATAYRLRLPTFDGGSVSLAPDGWGRAAIESGLDNGQHGPRLGIVVCAAAGVGVVGLVLWLLPPRRGSHTVGGAALVLAGGAALAGAATVVLVASATADSYRAALQANGARFRSDGVGLSFSWTVWLGAAAGVLLVAAVVVRACATHRDRGTEPTATLTERDAPNLPVTP